MAGLLRVKSVAEQLDISEGQVYRLVREGLLRCVKIGRAVRFNPEALQEFINQGGRAYPGGWKKEV